MIVSWFCRCYWTTVSNFRPNRFFCLCSVRWGSSSILNPPHLSLHHHRAASSAWSIPHPIRSCNVLLSHLTVPLPSNPLTEFSGLYDRLFVIVSQPIKLHAPGNYFMSNAVESASSGSSQSENGDLPADISRAVLGRNESKYLMPSPKSHSMQKQVGSFSSSPHAIDKKPTTAARSSFNVREANVFFDSRVTAFLRSPSRKCYGAPALSKARNPDPDGKTSLSDLRRVTKFSMVSQWFKMYLIVFWS